MDNIDYSLDNSTDKSYDINYRGAIEQPDGSWLNNNGNYNWYNVRGFVHREDGPGFIGSDKTVCWCIDGFVHYTLVDWCDVLNKSEEEKMLLKLQYE